jgi:glyoxylase-like metal-dependent hydrolase (beta-lactamase superfamily II)/rhodanese-related sulfurtransferase
MRVITARTPGLGDATYLVTHEGEAVLVDPQRDIGRFLAAAEEADVQVRYVLETHLHNDYVSGGREFARRTGAELVLPAGAGAAFPHTPAFHDEDLAGRTMTVRPLHTPGHTPEHVSYLVLIDGEPVAVFTGGSLLVGAAGRTDLLGPERARQLARLQYGSLRRLAALPVETGVYPTHGEGSFCTASGAGLTTSTIGHERRHSPVLAYPDAEAFADGQLAGLVPYPKYYAHMGPANLMGPAPAPEPSVPELSIDDVRALPDEVGLIDIRPRAAFAHAHMPGALNVELSDQFGVWVGWLLDWNSPIALVAEPEQDVEEAVTQLLRIGFDDVRGVFPDMAAWRRAGHPTRSHDLATPLDHVMAAARGERPQLLDVRAPDEWDAAHLPGSVHRYLPDLVDGVPDGLDATRPVWLACASGYRATIAAGLVERHGLRPVVVTEGGIADLLARTGHPAVA